jgi:uncharacterized protein YbjT (DUF2867 family)
MNSPHKIAVAGATGSLGRGIMSSLRARGIASVPISRSSGVDLTTGDGLDEALDGVTAVIDASSKNTTNATAATRFFSAATNNLLAAEGRAGVEHHVAVSIIGAAQIDAAYYAGKAAQERILTARESGWSVLRASQFHEFVEQIIEAGRMGPLQIVPTMRTQPVSIPEVAESLVVTRYLSAAGIRRRIVEIPLPGRFGRGMRDGTILPGRAARLGTRTFGEWLAA